MPPGTGPVDLHTVATEFHDAVVSALDSIPNFPAHDDLQPAPERTFVHFGEPVLDCCDQVAIYVLTISNLAEGAKALHPSIPGPRLVAVATRCVPQGRTVGTGDKAKYIPPTAAELTAAARQHNADGWAIFNHIQNLIRAHLFLASCDQFTFEGVVPIAPSGGCAGWQATARVELSGYAEELSP